MHILHCCQPCWDSACSFVVLATSAAWIKQLGVLWISVCRRQEGARAAASYVAAANRPFAKISVYALEFAIHTQSAKLHGKSVPWLKADGTMFAKHLLAMSNAPVLLHTLRACHLHCPTNVASRTVQHVCSLSLWIPVPIRHVCRIPWNPPPSIFLCF